MYLIWGIINIAFFVLFGALVLALFSKGKELFANKYGNAIILILVIGAIGMSNNSKDLNNKYSFNPSETNLKKYNSKSITARVDESIFFDLVYSVRFRENYQGELIPVNSYCDISGFRSGYDWEYLYSNIKKLDNGKFAFEIEGLMHWHLFGIVVYKQNKTFTGILESE